MYYVVYLFVAPDLMLDLMAVLSEKGLMKTHFLHLLIDSRLEKLDLSQCPAAANKAAVINLISARCKVGIYVLNCGEDN